MHRHFQAWKMGKWHFGRGNSMNKGIKLKNNKCHRKGTIHSSRLLQHKPQTGSYKTWRPMQTKLRSLEFMLQVMVSHWKRFALGSNVVKSEYEKNPGGCVEDGLNRYKTGRKETDKLRAWIRAVAREAGWPGTWYEKY